MDEAPGHAPRLVLTRAPRRPQGVVLLLHGGGGGSQTQAVGATQPSVLRMWSTAAAVVRAGRGHLVVARLLNATRGWGSDAGPVRDVHWALDRLGERFGGLPTALVGHSLGGRAALVASDRDEVRSAVALAAWTVPGDARRVRERQLLFVHGTTDRVAPLARAEAVARDLEAANEVFFVRLDGAGHALLREAWQVDALAADFARSTLLRVPPRLASTRRALHGASSVERDAEVER